MLLLIKKIRALQLLTNLKFRGEHIHFTEKTQNKKDKSSLPEGNKPEYNPHTRMASYKIRLYIKKN
jgi:hypothetical protein